jgi:hypothetical protein
MPPKFLQHSAQKEQTFDELAKAVKRQYDAGNISLPEVQKIIALVSNTTKLKNALRFL